MTVEVVRVQDPATPEVLRVHEGPQGPPGPAGGTGPPGPPGAQGIPGLLTILGSEPVPPDTPAGTLIVRY